MRAGDAPIDVQAIPERQRVGAAGAAPTFAQVWEEAHAEFRERIKKRPPPEVLDLSAGRNNDDDDDDDDALGDAAARQFNADAAARAHDDETK